MNKGKLKNKNGITLIALIITIIVMLILVAVTITVAVNGGLFKHAGDAVGDTKNAINDEQGLANGKINVDGNLYNSIDEYIEKGKIEAISTTESYIGYYADVDGNGTVDGIIYADLAVRGSEQYSDSDTVENIKNYYVSQIDYEGIFGMKNVLTAIGTGNDRFYVMALTDFTTSGDSYFYWYYYSYGNMSNYAEITSKDFGTGKVNTATMIEKWNNASYGVKINKDVWGCIKAQVSKGWFVPSLLEWSEFRNALGVKPSNISDYGLMEYYWTSSQTSSGDGAFTFCGFELMDWLGQPKLRVRLSATF